MKKTDTFTKILAYVLLGALVVYMAAWLWRSTHNSVVTAPVTAVTVSDSVQADGVAVRQEELLTSDRTYVSVQAQDGQAVASGSTLALDTLLTLARHPRIVAVKDCGGDAAMTAALIASGVDKAISDITNGKHDRFRAEVRNFAKDYATQVEYDYASFRSAYLAGQTLY